MDYSETILFTAHFIGFYLSNYISFSAAWVYVYGFIVK